MHCFCVRIALLKKSGIFGGTRCIHGENVCVLPGLWVYSFVPNLTCPSIFRLHMPSRRRMMTVIASNAGSYWHLMLIGPYESPKNPWVPNIDILSGLFRGVVAIVLYNSIIPGQKRLLLHMLNKYWHIFFSHAHWNQLWIKMYFLNPMVVVTSVALGIQSSFHSLFRNLCVSYVLDWRLGYLPCENL